jgi:hypothetical protein
MKNTCLIRCLAIVLAYSAPLSLLHADEMNDLISTVMQASPEVKAKAQAYVRPSKKASPSTKAPSAGKNLTGVPNMQIPDGEVLEVASKFPKDYVGKYVYGPVTFGNMDDPDSTGVAIIRFWSKNMRCYAFKTGNPAIIQTFHGFQYGSKFMIPRDCPLQIFDKAGFNYLLKLPFDQSQIVQ